MDEAARELVIGPATESDHEALFEIYRGVVASGGAQPDGGAADRDVFHEGWIRRRRVYVARAGDTAIGGYFLRTNFPAFAAHIAQGGYLVAESARRRGVGSRLLTHSLEEAARLGYTAMMFNLVQQHNPSRLMYERAGFKIIGTIPNTHGNEAGLIYWRSLP
ncbi:GNAT family N-acetyltransferase [Microlunatus sp. GCM10028923]|uniref:GNAT family N-acetyltransferase n=1 Tax=Microlunatus sp. GCM10028923 TaxID=3273400 RepID=UPI00360FEA71